MLELSGIVLHGDGYGRILGFPTANIDRRSYSQRKLKLKFGIYAGWVKIENCKLKIKNYRGAVVIGPLDKKGLPKLEAHLIGFKGNLYGKRLTFKLRTFIRPYKKFKNIEDLKIQIQKDMINIRKLV